MKHQKALILLWVGFGLAAATTLAQSINVTPTGVGIGTAVPSTPLHVRTSGIFSSTVTGTSAGPSGLMALRNDNSVTGWNFGIETGTGWASGPAGAFYIDQNGVGPRLTVTPVGNVGVGTTNPMQKLDVAGNVAVSGNIAVAGSITVAGKILGSSFESAGYSLENPPTQINHGLGVVPKRCNVFLRCKVSHDGFIIGDEIIIPIVASFDREYKDWDGNHIQDKAPAWYVRMNSTTIYFVNSGFFNSFIGYLIRPVSGYTPDLLKWDIVFRASAIY